MVGEIIDSGQQYGGHAYRDCIAEAASHHVPIVVAPTAERISFHDGTSVAFLGPTKPFFIDGDNDVNENSVVAMLTYGSFRALFMGDAGAQSEERLLASGFDLHADVLKVGHHGSAYSSTPAFIRAVRPRLSLISGDATIFFGHPALETLATLRNANAAIYRTDLNGAIIVTVVISTMSSNTVRAVTQAPSFAR